MAWIWLICRKQAHKRGCCRNWFMSHYNTTHFPPKTNNRHHIVLPHPHMGLNYLPSCMKYRVILSSFTIKLCQLAIIPLTESARALEVDAGDFVPGVSRATSVCGESDILKVSTKQWLKQCYTLTSHQRHDNSSTTRLFVQQLAQPNKKKASKLRTIGHFLRINPTPVSPHPRMGK